MKKRDLLLGLLFLVTLAVRLYFALKTSHFSYDAYFHINFIEHIAESGRLRIEDALSYGGRTLIVLPLFYYVLAGFAKLFSLEIAAKVVPQVFMSFLPIIVFFIVEKITKRFDGAFFSAVISAFVPLLFANTLFSVSPVTLVIPFLFLTLFLFLHIEKKPSVLYFILIIAALSLIHPSSVFLIVGLLGYLLISRLEGFRVEKAELELILFSVFIFLWTQFIFYKRAFLFHGISLIQQNIPSEIVSNYFTNITLSSTLVQIGILPVVGGVFVIYKYLFNNKSKPLYMYVSLSIVVALFLWLRLIQPSLGFMYLSVCLSILSGQAYVSFVQYLGKTRVFRVSTILIVLVWLLIVPTMVIPSLLFASAERDITVSPAIYDAMVWIRENTPEDSVVATVPREGHLVANIAQRRNVMDNYFLLIEDAEERIADVRRLFTTQFGTEAVKIFEKYDIDYVIVSENTARDYSVESIAYVDEECLSQVYNQETVAVYHSRCRITVA